MKKSILKVEFDYDFDLLAIVSPVKDYRLCWYINNEIKTKFKRKNDLEINSAKLKQVSFFSLFHHFDGLSKRDYYLVSNKSSGSFLVKELKEVDFFIAIYGYISEEEKEDLTEKLRSLNIIQAIFEVDPNQLASKKNLIFDDSII